MCLTAVRESLPNSCADKGNITATLIEQEKCSYISCKLNQGSTVFYRYIQASFKAKIVAQAY